MILMKTPQHSGALGARVKTTFGSLLVELRDNPRSDYSVIRRWLLEAANRK